MIRDDMYIYELPHNVKGHILLEAKNMGLKGLELRKILSSKVDDCGYDISIKAIYYHYIVDTHNESFNKEAFYEFLISEFPSIDFNNQFMYQLLDNIIDKGLDSPTIDHISYFVSDLIPEVTFREVQAFDYNHYKKMCSDIELKYGSFDEAKKFIDRIIESAGETGNKMYSDAEVGELLNKARSNQAIFNKYAEEFIYGHDLIVLKSAVDNWDFSVEDFDRYDSDVKEKFIMIMEEAEQEMDKQLRQPKVR